MVSQSALGALLGQARLATYLQAAGGDVDRAADLYLWATELSGALHAQISFVEIAVRNAIDPQLATWNSAQGPDFGPDWTRAFGAAPLLYTLLKSELRSARTWAQKDVDQRHRDHPRHATAVTHDDVVAQLTFGAWVKVIRPLSNTESDDRHRQLWHEALHRAFPQTTGTDADRVAIGRQLETLRKLRNRVAHHDNLLNVEITRRLNGMLSLLAKIDHSYPGLAAARSRLRRLHRQDPRRHWHS